MVQENNINTTKQTDFPENVFGAKGKYASHVNLVLTMLKVTITCLLPLILVISNTN